MADDILINETDFHQSAETHTSDIEGDIHVPGHSSDSEDDQSTLDESVATTLKRDLSAIGRKFLFVLVPRRNTALLRDWDLWGPLILCILMATLLQGSDDGAPQFAQVFAIVWLGATVVTLNSKLLGGTISFFQSLCVLGYCVLPLAIALIISKIIIVAHPVSTTAVFAVRSLIVLGTLVWSCFASVGFLGDSQPLHRKPLAVYPICLFYFVLSWMVVSHSG